MFICYKVIRNIPYRHLENIRALRMPYVRDITGIKLPAFSDTVDPELEEPGFRPFMAAQGNMAPTWPEIIEGSRLEYMQRHSKFLRVGQGEVGEVYLARYHQDHSDLVAVKLIHKDLSLDLVLHEAAVATHLNVTGATAMCHGIVPLCASRRYQSVAVVYEFIGEPHTYVIKDWNELLVESSGDNPKVRLGRQDWLIIAQQLVRKVMEVHEQGMVLTDIKGKGHITELKSHERRLKPPLFKSLFRIPTKKPTKLRSDGPLCVRVISRWIYRWPMDSSHRGP